MTHAIILTTQRTGSTFLVTCLDSHPAVCCRGELLMGSRSVFVPNFIYRYRFGIKAYRYLRSGTWLPTRVMRRFLDEGYLTGENLGLHPVMAFKVMYNQMKPPWIRNFLLKRRDLRILHLRRDNLLKAYVSGVLLKVKRDESWKPHTTSPVTPVRMHVSGAHAIAFLRRSVIDREFHEHLFREHRCLALSYETLIDGQALRADTARDICRFLDIDVRPLRSNLVKMNPERLQDMVENYDELASAISKTEFAAMLD